MQPITTIEYLTGSDELGRCRFFLNWIDKGRRRSQVFFANPEGYGHNKPDNRNTDYERD